MAFRETGEMESTSEQRIVRHEEPSCGRRASSAAGWAAAPRHQAHDPHWQIARGLDRNPAAPLGRMSDGGGADASVAVEPAQRLLQLTQELGRVAGEIAERSKPLAAGERRVDAAFVRFLIRARQRRVTAFGPDLFADPVWDMMLDLLAARLEGRRVSTSSLCIAAGVPSTTALRWIRLLTERGLFVRVADPRDGRGVLVELSEDTAERLMAHLATSNRALPT